MGSCQQNVNWKSDVSESMLHIAKTIAAVTVYVVLRNVHNTPAL